MDAAEREKLYRLRYELKRGELIYRAREGKILSFTLATKSDYEVSWHHKLTAQYINKFIRKEIRRLIILEPPRCGKSELSSRRLPALIHGIKPNDEILLASYNADLASDMTVDVQRIMDTETYREIFPYSRITPDGSKSQWARSKSEHELIPVDRASGAWEPPGVAMLFDGNRFLPQGSFRSAGIGGSFTGKGGKWIFIDDPVKNWEDADSKAFRDMQWDWYRSTVRTRLEKDASILLTLTHWHRDDLAGKLQALMKADKDADQWFILKLPMIKENDTNPEDPRDIGDVLWPTKFSPQDVKATKASSGTRIWSALYQQDPTAEGGNIIKREEFQQYTVAPTELDTMIISCDTAAKDKTTSDYYVYQVWGRKFADCYFIYQLRGRWDFPTASRKLLELVRMFPKARKRLIENKTNGPAIVQALRKVITGLIEVEPQGDKVARVNAVHPMIQSGNVWIPNEEMFPWVQEFLSEVADFPLGRHDDQVDAMTQALLELEKSGPVYAPSAGHGMDD